MSDDWNRAMEQARKVSCQLSEEGVEWVARAILKANAEVLRDRSITRSAAGLLWSALTIEDHLRERAAELEWVAKEGK